MHDAGSATGVDTAWPPKVDERQGGPLVLNVNDNDASRYLVTRMLEKGGFTVIEAATGRGALERVRRDQPRLVVLDIKLPDMNGLEVCQRIKADPFTHAREGAAYLGGLRRH